jgi:GntR family transcriptional regulator/MocR family aminotransferase
MTTRGWTLSLDPRRHDGEPTFLAIAREVIDAIQAGRLRAGDPLPGSRTLATDLGVHRNTVLAATRELEIQGWIEATAGKGTFVRTALPEPSPRALRGASRAAREPSRLGFPLAGVEAAADAWEPIPRGALPLLGGLADLRLVPREAIARAYRRAMLRRDRHALDYGDPRGDERLRAALADMLGHLRGVARAERGLVVTRGSQQALYLAARAILAPGSVVAVEALGYQPAWEALRLAGARVQPIPIDAEGMRVDALEALAAAADREPGGALRAVYVTPHHQYPTTVTLSPARRLQLLDLARRRGVAVLEDDYDHEFHFDGRPPLPLASADAHGVVVYVGTLSKVLAPGLRIGFVVAPEPLADRIAALRRCVDRQGDLVVERAVAELLEEGELQRHVRKMRKTYQARRDALVDALGRHLGDALRFRVPRGGLAIWARTARDVDTTTWELRAREAGVIVQSSSRWAGRKTPAFRLGYAPVDEREIEIAVRRLAAARPRARA